MSQNVTLFVIFDSQNNVNYLNFNIIIPIEPIRNASKQR